MHQEVNVHNAPTTQLTSPFSFSSLGWGAVTLHPEITGAVGYVSNLGAVRYQDKRYAVVWQWGGTLI